MRQLVSLATVVLLACGGGHGSPPDGAAPRDASVPGPTLTARPGQNEALLSWTALAGVTSYNVYRSSARGAQGALLATVSAMDLDDTMLTNFQPEWYSVTGVVAGSGESAPSNQANAFGYDLSHWTVRREAFELTSFAYASASQTTSGKATYVVVGAAGTILTSNDGATWTIVPQLPVARLDSVTFGNGLFVAVGYAVGSQNIFTSADGLMWTTYDSGENVELISVTYAVANSLGTLSPMFIAAGAGGTLVTSPDGVTWTKRSCGTRELDTVTSVTHSNMFADSYLAIASGNGTACSSTDGITWTPITLTGAAATGYYVSSIGDAATSSIWMVDAGGLVYQQPYNFVTHALGAPVTATLPATGSHYSGSTSYVDAAMARHVVIARTDGTLWDTTATAPGGFTQLAAAMPTLESAPAFESIGSAGTSLFVVTTNEQILRSDDGGATLVVSRDDPGGSNRSVVSLGALTVVDQGVGAILSSTDSATFTPGTTGATGLSFPLVKTATGVSLVYADDTNNAVQIYESTDAQTWTQTTAMLALCNGCQPYNTGWVLATDNGGYVISMTEYNAGTAAVTSLGVTGSAAAGFTTGTQTPNNPFVQTWKVGNTFYGLTDFYVANNISAIMESADGVTWTMLQLFPSTFLGRYYLDDGATKYVVDSTGKVSSSTDGTTWSPPAVLDPGGRALDRLIRLGDHLIAIGAGGLISASLDGVHWTAIAPLTIASYNDVVLTDHGIEIVGDHDVVLTAP